jgi:molecular chaperone GrpE
MKNKEPEKPKQEPEITEQAASAKKSEVDLNGLMEQLLVAKDENFDALFLTGEDKQLIDALPREHKESVHAALATKGMLFKSLRGRLQRISAEYANLQKRVPKQITEMVDYEKERIIKSFLPALDNFGHLLEGIKPEQVDAHIKGIQIIYDHILDILKSHGVEQIKALGEVFDPVLHQAMMHRTEPDKPDNIVLEEFQNGYKLNGRVIRPSKVVINKLPAAPAITEQKTVEDQQETGAQETKNENAGGEGEE